MLYYDVVCVCVCHLCLKRNRIERVGVGVVVD